jgi:8-oxo-dGTP pyrophosphatase MutT (NUDIX family)
MRANEFTQPQAAGCIIVAEDTGRWCLQQRSDTVSDPGVWSTWGGGREPGETLEQTVRRELAEEGGYVGPLTLEPLSRNSQYATFIGHVPHEFEPRINKESKDWCWCSADQLPEPMHPGLAQALGWLTEDAYTALDPYQCGPFDGGCVLVAKALQKIHGGDIVVLVNNHDQAQHAAVAVNGKLMDYSGADVAKHFVRKFEAEEHVDITGVRPIRHGDLPEAPHDDPQVIDQLVQVLSENFADGKVKGRSRPGRVKRAGASCNGSVTDLRARAKKYGGERGRMYHWCANMKSGKRK